MFCKKDLNISQNLQGNNCIGVFLLINLHAFFLYPPENIKKPRGYKKKAYNFIIVETQT